MYIKYIEYLVGSVDDKYHYYYYCNLVKKPLFIIFFSFCFSRIVMPRQSL